MVLIAVYETPGELLRVLAPHPATRALHVLDFLTGLLPARKTEFQMRDPHQPQFVQGKIEASVSVYDSRPLVGASGRFPLTPVRTIHPDKAPALMSATQAVWIREGAYRKFAEQVARKFYEYTMAP